MLIRKLRHLLRDLFGRRRAEDELDEEIRAHLELEIQALQEAGLPAAAARRQALADFGAVEAIKDECRDSRMTRPLDSLWLDLRHAVRMLYRYPLFSSTSALTLGLTIGAVATVFSLSHTFNERPLPVPEAEQIVWIDAKRAPDRVGAPVSYPDFRHLRASATALSDLAAIYSTAPLFVTLPGGEEGRQVNGAVVSADFFPLLRLPPARGRYFGADEDAVPGRDRVVVLGHAFWQAGFGGAPDAVGSVLRVNGVDFTVVGVAPPEFSGVEAQPINLFLPTMMLPVGYRWCEDSLAPDCTVLRMLGRLAEGSSLEQATDDLNSSLPPGWAEAEAGDNSGIRVTWARGAYLSRVDRSFLRLLAVVGGVLLLVCSANLMGMMLSRGRARAAELAVRTSLGASRARLARQLMVESLLLAFVGGVVGLICSVLMTTALNTAFYSVDSSGRPLVYDFGLEPVVVATVLTVAVGVGLLFGVAPAFLLARQGAHAAAGSSRTVASGGLGGRWLIGAQTALAVGLVGVATLLTVGARDLLGGRNFDPDGVALLRLRPLLLGYGPAQGQDFVAQVVDRLEREPAVESVSIVGTGIALLGLAVDVETLGDEPVAARTGYLEIGPDYFDTLRIPFLRGRDFSKADTATAPGVAILSETAVRVLFENDEPLGRTLHVRDRELEVVGVVGDVHLGSRTDAQRPYVYVPFWQNETVTDARLQVRVNGDPSAVIPDLRAAIAAIDPDVPVSETISLNQRLAGLFRPQRLSATAVVYAAALSVLLSALGLYASLAASVARRRREIGIRQAIGATAQGVSRMVATDGLRAVLAGSLFGVALGWATTRWLRHLLYAPASNDPWLLTAAALCVGAAALIAAWIPARRAARVRPMEALRAD